MTSPSSPQLNRDRPSHKVDTDNTSVSVESDSPISDVFQRQRWSPLGTQSILGRLFILFTVGLLLAQLLTGVLYWSDRQLNTTPARIQTLGDRVIAIATLVKSTPADQHIILTDALNGPMLNVAIVSEPPPELLSEGSQKGRRGERLQEQRSNGPPLHDAGRKSHHTPGNKSHDKRFSPIRQKRLTQLQTYLSQAIGDSVFIDVQPSPPHQRMGQDSSVSSPGLPPDTLVPSRHQVVVLVQQQPQWLMMTVPIGFGSRHHGPRFPLLLLTMGLLLWILFAWATRRITDPLLQFAAAADRLGLDVNAPPLPEHGARELRQASQAFNRMQGRLQRLIRDRTFMLAAISHDLRTILTRLRLRTELMEDEVQQQKVQNDLSQMEIMLHSTLSFAKEESTPEARTAVDLSSLIQSVCDDLVDSGHRVACDSGDRITLQGQPTALRRAFTNLIENGAIYGQQVNVSVKTYVYASEKMAVVTIKDRGPGIAPNMREQVFKPFFRLERSRNRETGGTGLGLAVARTVIRRHGGDITLQNYPHPDVVGQADGGLMITVQLPKA